MKKIIPVLVLLAMFVGNKAYSETCVGTLFFVPGQEKDFTGSFCDYNIKGDIAPENKDAGDRLLGSNLNQELGIDVCVFTFDELNTDALYQGTYTIVTAVIAPYFQISSKPWFGNKGGSLTIRCLAAPLVAAALSVGEVSINITKD